MVRAVQDGGAGIGKSRGENSGAGSRGESEHRMAAGNGGEVSDQVDPDLGVDEGRVGSGPTDGSEAGGGYFGVFEQVGEVSVKYCW